MALNFPDNPIANVTTHTVGDVIYTFDGEKWVAAAVPIEPPDLTSVALAEGAGNSNRFTSSTFTVTPTIAEDGNPGSAKDLKISITPDIIATPVTEAISAVGTAAVTDGVSRQLLNDNSWNNILYLGAPYNCYFAQGNGTSQQNAATSTDGRNWTRIILTRGGTAANLPTIAYCPVDGALYYMTAEYVSSSGTRPVAYRAAPGTFDFNREPYNPSMGGINANSSHFSWGDLTWDYVQNRWYCMRLSSSNGYSASLVRGPTTASMASGWTDLGGQIYGYQLGRFRIHQDGSSTHSINGANQSGSPTGNKTFYHSQPWSSTSGYWILGSGRDPVGRWMKVGTVGWVTAGSNSYNTNRGDHIHHSLGASPANTTTPTMTAISTLFTDVTYADMRDSIYIDSLGIGVLCGQLSTATREREGAILITTDCVNWTRHWTNPDGDNSQYRWSFMHWDDTRNELLLVADQGTYPAGRAGYSKTVQQAVNFTELTFTAATGLNNFSTGASITQSDNNATGSVVEIDEDAGTMAVDTLTGAFTTNQTVEADAGNFTKGYLVFDSNGNVSGITPSDPGWTRMNGNGPYTITMPATFDDGNAPDTSCIAGSAISAEMRLISTSQGFTATDSAESADITPT